MKVKNDGAGAIRYDYTDPVTEVVTEYLLGAGEVRDVPPGVATKLILVDDRIRLAEPSEV